MGDNMPPRTMFADSYDESSDYETEHAPPDSGDRLISKIVDFVRKTNITVSPPAHIKPIIWSDAVDLTVRVNLPAAVSPYQTVVSFTTPPGRYTRIEAFGVNVLDSAYTYDGSILWRLTKNQRPIGDGLSNWGIQKGSVILPRKTFIVLKEDDVVEFQIRRAVAAAGAQDVDMALMGYIWRLRNNYEGTQASVTAF